MAKGSYYFPFYYQRFYDSTTGWTEEQEGAYMRLLTYQFGKGSIPNNMKLIKKISPKAVKNWSLFSSKFEQNSDGNLINITMDNIRNEMMVIKDKNLRNGKLGGRPKNRTVNSGLTQTITQTEPIPLTINHKPLNTERVQDAHKPDLSESNIFRKPSVPTFEKVHEAFLNHGGTEEMARKFYDNNSSTDWYFKSSPIKNFITLIPGFIQAWKNNTAKDKKSEPVYSGAAPLKILH